MCFVSCLRKTKCNITPIRFNVVDTLQIKGDIVFENKLGNVDTLVLIDHYNILNEVTKKSLMTDIECGHSLGFDYDSSNGFGTISIGIKKDHKNEYTFSVNGFCISKEIKMSKKVAEKDSLITIDIEKCDKSKLKKIAFRKLKIEYFETQDGNIWKPIKFIPRSL
ncbi:hypothetical protein BWK59_12030 [Flavobacterium davisii]|nr:hypothetical protein BWK59_12030 [Flavobacterium davisii]